MPKIRPFGSDDEGNPDIIVEMKCIKCGALIDCRRFLCEECYKKMKNSAKIN